jgi:hypothetical protein
MALFDYDPHEMSPNQDNEEELPFKQGQIIKVKFNYSTLNLLLRIEFRYMVIKMLMVFILVKSKMVVPVLFLVIWFQKSTLMILKQNHMFLLVPL